MTFATISRAASDPDLTARVTSAAHKEILYNDALAVTTFGRQLSSGLVNMASIMWPVAVDTEAAYETAVNSGRGAPGHDVDIITDGAITSAVIAHWPYTADEQTARVGVLNWTVDGLTMNLDIARGMAGSTYHVDWGDGYDDDVALDGDGDATFSHLYIAGMWQITLTASNGVVVPAGPFLVPPVPEV